MNRKLTKARRDVERLRLQADGAGQTEIHIWEASNRVADLEASERQAAVRTARTAGRIMDAVLLVVALLTMAFSLQNIHDFAAGHGVQDPIAWFLAPAVDLALLAALMGDAVLSRWQLDAGPWAVRLRWYAGITTVVLNGWEAVAALDLAGIVLHVVPPILLFVLAEAASPYRVAFAETVKLAAVSTGPSTETAPVSTPQVTTAAEQAPAEVGSVDTLVSTPELEAAEVDTPEPGRLDAEAAKAAIEAGWTAGRSIRETAALATRHHSYVARVYAALEAERGTQPTPGQLALVK
jgi:hypothetical protein